MRVKWRLLKIMFLDTKLTIQIPAEYLVHFAERKNRVTSAFVVLETTTIFFLVIIKILNGQ